MEAPFSLYSRTACAHREVELAVPCWEKSPRLIRGCISSFYAESGLVGRLGHQGPRCQCPGMAGAERAGQGCPAFPGVAPRSEGLPSTFQSGEGSALGQDESQEPQECGAFACRLPGRTQAWSQTWLNRRRKWMFPCSACRKDSRGHPAVWTRWAMCVLQGTEGLGGPVVSSALRSGGPKGALSLTSEEELDGKTRVKEIGLHSGSNRWRALKGLLSFF